MKSYNFYNLSNDGSYTIIPLTEGDGTYQVSVYKYIDSRVSRLVSKSFQVTLNSEFSPFLHSNQCVSYSKYGTVPALAQILTANSDSDLESLQIIYNYVVNYLTYDYAKAAAAKNATMSDFVPDIEQIYTLKTGICYDYAALTSAMLRSVGIRAKLEIGDYTTSTNVSFHAWISVYIDGMGWLNGVIEFEGDSWTMLDPTFASTSGRLETYIMSKSRYTVVYIE